MPQTLIRKLEHFARLSNDDKKILHRIAAERTRNLGAREELIHEGEEPRFVYLMQSGWACRYKQLEDGRRQIVAFFLPGDLCDLNVFILRRMDHSIGTITAVSFAEISRDAFEEMTLSHPRITRALWWETLVNASIQREWTVNLGRRDALERMAHLFCELFIRLRMAGFADGDSCAFPVTQSDLADAVGMSAVHVNRTLQELRALDLIVLKDRRLTIPDLDALKSAAQFTDDYLHLDREGQYLDANA